jgi:cytochrome b involved in lipid metabolism
MSTDAVYTREEVSKHNTPEDAWIVIDNNVYDISKFAKIHPGGTQILLDYAGRRSLSELNGFHGLTVHRARCH